MSRKKKVLVMNSIPQPGVALLQEHGFQVEIGSGRFPDSSEELFHYLKDKEGIISLLSDKIDRTIIDSAPMLKIIANYAVGFNNIDVNYARSKGIQVSNTPDVLTPTTADLTWALILSVSKRIVESDHFMRQGLFTGWEPSLMLGGDVTGKTLGIIGAGRIGQAVARRARGFEMKILYSGNTSKADFEKETGARMAALEDLLKESDFISLHCPLTAETHHLLNKKNLRLMKKSAYVINTSRGAVIDEQALVDALKKRTIAGAGLDVYEFEPRVHEDLFNLDNVALLPHIGSGTTETRDEMSRMTARNVISVLDGGNALHPVH